MIESYRAIIILIILCGYAECAWKWAFGSSSAIGWGDNGIRNVTSVNSYTPGTTDHTMFYDMDSKRFWMFGGETGSGFSDNIWYYRADIPAWTWLYGSGNSYPSPISSIRTKLRSDFLNQPGGRTFTTCFVDDGFLWTFGGLLDDVIVTNSVFRFDLAGERWQWVSGRIETGFEGVFGAKGIESSSNEPPALYGFAHGYDPSEKMLYVFGGGHVARDTSILKKSSATWTFSTRSLNWTWVNGPSEFDVRATYGNRTVGTSLTIPGARFKCSSYYDLTTKTLFMFGGFGISIQVEGSLNDLWTYRTNSNTWTFMAGDIAPDSNGRADLRNIYSPSFTPRSRFSASIAFDPLKNVLYMFGGASIRISSTQNYNDLWRYSFDLNMWCHLAGSLSPNLAGSFGTKGVASQTNQPPGKSGNAYAWDSSRSVLVLHGGISVSSGFMGEVWEFNDDFPAASVLSSTTAEAVATSTIQTSLEVRDRTRFSNEEPQPVATSLSTEAIIGISGGTAFVLVVMTLIIMFFIRRQSYKNALLAESKTKGDSTVDESTELRASGVTANRSRKANSGSSTLDLSVVKMPSPIVKYSVESVTSAKKSVSDVPTVSGSDFDCVLQTGTQNGAALYNAITVDLNKLRTDRLTVKVFGKDLESLASGVEDAFCEEASLLLKLSSFDIRITSLVALSMEPVALLFPAYPLGNLESYMNQNASLTPLDVFQIVLDIAAALKALHGLGYPHRNVKPRNIFVEKEKRLRGVLSGFGGLQNVGTDDQAALKAFPLYRIDAKAANYVAPEVFSAIRNQVTSTPSVAIKHGDQFSLAILISKMLKVTKL